MEERLVTAPVLFEELPCGEFKLGRITLSVKATLNSLTLEMVDLLQKQLDAWADNPEIVLVFIEGAGEKAFCAGGDVQALHQSATEKPGGPCDYAETFFAREYRMNYTLHTYPKPIICWGHGIVMGGGLGVLAGCSHRVVTQATRIAMPEVTIALFPDVGGSWFLNRAPGHSGRFLAMTGASINAADAIFVGFADWFIADAHKESVIEHLQTQDWAANNDENHARVSHVLRPFSDKSVDHRSAGQVQPHLETINGLMNEGTVHQVIDRLSQLETDDRWLSKARNNLSHGSKLAALWIDHQLRVTRHSSLKEVFQSELRLATQIVRHPEFSEGVRALLIDKDQKPAWQFASSRDVPSDVLAGFFKDPWDTNQLADLK